MRLYTVTIELRSGHRLHLLTTASSKDDALTTILRTFDHSGLILEDFEKTNASAQEWPLGPTA